MSIKGGSTVYRNSHTPNLLEVEEVVNHCKVICLCRRRFQHGGEPAVLFWLLWGNVWSHMLWVWSEDRRRWALDWGSPTTVALPLLCLWGRSISSLLLARVPHVCTHNTHTRTRTHACTHTRMHTHAHARTRMHAHTRARTHMHTRTHVHTRAHAHAHTNTRTHICTHTPFVTWTPGFIQVNIGDLVDSFVVILIPPLLCLWGRSISSLLLARVPHVCTHNTHTRMNTHAHAHTRACTHTRMHAHAHTRARTHTHTRALFVCEVGAFLAYF